MPKNNTEYKKGDLVFGIDEELNIVDKCAGFVTEVHEKPDGSKLYNVQFDNGNFLLTALQLTSELEL